MTELATATLIRIPLVFFGLAVMVALKIAWEVACIRGSI